MGYDLDQYKIDIDNLKTYMLENNIQDKLLERFVLNVVMGTYLLVKNADKQINESKQEAENWKRRHHELLTSYNQKWGEEISKELKCQNTQNDQKTP